MSVHHSSGSLEMSINGRNSRSIVKENDDIGDETTLQNLQYGRPGVGGGGV